MNTITFSFITSFTYYTGLGTYSACMLWLGASWALNLIDTFKSYLSLFIVMFSTLTSAHHCFLTSHITTYYIHHLSFFPHHCLLDTILVSPWVVVFHTSLYGRQSHPSPSSPHGWWFRDLILRCCVVSEESLLMWFHFHGRSFIID